MTELTDVAPRCCPAHADWPTLAAHLVDAFADLPPTIVLRELARARDAVTQVGMPVEDVLPTVETIARYQLMMCSGRFGDAARLDPQRRVRRTGRSGREGGRAAV